MANVRAKTAIAFLPADLSVTVRASPVSVSRECKGQSRKGMFSAWDGSLSDHSERQSEVDLKCGLDIHATREIPNGA